MHTKHNKFNDELNICYTYSEEEINIFQQTHKPYEPKEIRNDIDFLQKKERNIRKLLSMGPYTDFLTISFQRNATLENAKVHILTMHRRANRRLFGPRWQKKGITPVSGVGVYELATIHAEHRETSKVHIKARDRAVQGNVHFHALIKPHHKLSTDETSRAAQLLEAYNHAAKRCVTNSDSPLPLVSRTGGNLVKPIWYLRGLAEYCMKDSGTNDWSWDERVEYLGS